MTDQLVTVRPVAVASQGGWINVGGSSALASVTDNLDTSYVHSGAGNVSSIYFQMAAPPGLTSAHRITGVVARIRCNGNPAPPNCRRPSFGIAGAVGGPFWDTQDNANVFFPTNTIINIASPTWTYRSSLQSPGHIGNIQYSYLSLADLSNCYFWVKDDSGVDLNVYEVYLDIYYNTRPVVSNLQPTGAVVDQPQPTVTWTYTDAENEAQERYQVKVFDQATYSAAGFSPDTSVSSVWESGVVYSSSASAAITGPGYHPDTSQTYPSIALLNGVTYQVYVRVGDVGSPSNVWSDWNYIGATGSPGNPITISYTPPGQPTNVSCVPDNANARYAINFTPGGSLSSPITYYFEIQRSDDGGVTWFNPRGGDIFMNVGGPWIVSGNLVPAVPQTFYDIDIFPLVVPQYRMRAFRSLPAPPGGVGQFVPNTFISCNPSAPLAPGKWWLKDPADSTLNIPIEVVPPFTFQRREPQGLYDPMGRSTSVYVSDGMKSIHGSLKIRTRTKADYDKLWKIIGNARTLVLEDWSYGRRWFVKMGDSGDYTTVLSAPDVGSPGPVRHLTETTYSFREVAKP